ncbi:MAG: hypothetical protein AB7P34_09400 [Vicinamibacterales bacterium]
MAPRKSPSWHLVVSVGALLVTLLFLMGLVGLSIVGYQVPAGSRFLLVLVLAISAGIGAGGLGGYAAAEGHIPVPGLNQHPLAVRLGGGIAVMFLMLLLRDQIVPPPAPEGPLPGSLQLESLVGEPTSADPPRVMLTARFNGFSVAETDRLLLALCADPQCGAMVRKDRVDNPTQGRMVVFALSLPAGIQAGQLILERGPGGEVVTGRPVAVVW